VHPCTVDSLGFFQVKSPPSVASNWSSSVTAVSSWSSSVATVSCTAPVSPPSYASSSLASPSAATATENLSTPWSLAVSEALRSDSAPLHASSPTSAPSSLTSPPSSVADSRKTLVATSPSQHSPSADAATS